MEERAHDLEVADDQLVFRLMSLATVSFNLPSPAPIVNLQEMESPYRGLPFPVGLPEAQAIAAAQHFLPGPRPSTHELFSSVLRQTKTEVVAVRIVRYEDGVFYAELDLRSPQGRVILDCRPTDAIVLALRETVAAPILCAESVLSQFYV
jgi:bifunctional DNase/RNase